MVALLKIGKHPQVEQFYRNRQPKSTDEQFLFNYALYKSNNNQEILDNLQKN